MKLYISTGNSRMEKKWNGQEMEFSVFLERLSHTVRTSETMEQYRKMSKAKQDSIKDVDGFVLGKLKGGRRKKANVLFRSGLTLDMDYATEDIAEQIEMFFDFRCLIYSTHKHTPEKPRLRLIIPLSRTVSPDEYAAVARKVAEDIGMELFDDTTYEPSRLMYWPSTSADGEFFFRDIPGTFLNPDSVLERYADWRDSSSWPVSSRQKAVVSREMKKQADPLSKEGIVGAFCRTYSIEEAIRIFLPDVYQESMMPERFDYIPADSQAGVVIYEGKFAYSHHATDPACGKLLNAFDIVRIHKFGEQDDKAEEGTDSGKLPSFKAMSDFAVSDEQVKITLAKEREKAASEEFDVDTGEWQTMLDLDRQGKVKDTLSNIATIIRFDENLQPIVFNQLKNALDVIGELPWVQVKKGWGDADIACAKLYFERVYGIWSPTKFKDALLAVVSSERLYHPVKEYFSTLSWDGCSRIDSLLIDYMGAENTPYVRAVTRKTLVAAVFSSIFTLISMLNNNKAVTAVICILTAFLFLIIGAQLHKMLSEPETNMALVMTDNGQEYQELPNPKFLDGGGRKTVQFFYDFLPGGQVVQCTSLETENLSLLPVYSLVIVVLTTSAGMFFFKKKELK